MAQPSPALLLLILVAAGTGAGFLLSQKPAAPRAAPQPPAAAVPESGGLQPSVKASPSISQPAPAEDLEAQIMLLEGQVEYLQGQVNALQEENAALLQKLGTLGMQGVPKMETPGPGGGEDDGLPPDFVGMGIEMMQFRQIQSLPTPTAGASLADVEKAILTWMRQQQPGDEGPRLGLALAAMGWIEKPVDPLPIRAALWARQLGGWYDAASGTLLVAEKDPIPGKLAPDAPLAIAFGQLLREYGDVLFPVEKKRLLSTDERLARESLLAGDAGLTRFLFSLRNPAAAPPGDLPAEDPDHPLNDVQAPVFIRELSMFPFRPGFEFAQALHSAGDFAQLNAAYSRPPRDCAEVIEVERYLDNSMLPPVIPQFASTAAGENKPYWDDSLGRFAVFNALRVHNSDEEAGQAARGWQGDRLLAYAAPDQPRDHAAWQTLWMNREAADAFFKTMRYSLLQRYDAAPQTDTAEELSLSNDGRTVRLLRNRSGQGVLLIDAATPEFAHTLQSTLNASKGGSP